MVGPALPADSMLPPVLGLYVNTSPMLLENAPLDPDPPPLLLDAKVTGGGGGGAKIGAADPAALCSESFIQSVTCFPIYRCVATISSLRF